MALCKFHIIIIIIIQPEVPATSVLSASSAASDDTPPKPGGVVLVRLVGVAHVVDAASAGYIESVLISTFQPMMLWTLPSIGPHGE